MEASLAKNQRAKIQRPKIQRSTALIKIAMAVVVLVQVYRIYTSGVVDFGELAGAFGALSLLRGVLLSPVLLATPMRSWSEPEVFICSQSYKHFAFGTVLVVISVF